MPKKIRTNHSLPFFNPPSTRNFQITTILQQVHEFSQDFTNKVGTFYQLKNLINQHQFSENLEILEKSASISGGFALFIIQNIQTLEVA